MNDNIFCPLKDFNECKCEKNSTTCRGQFMIVEKKDFIYIVIGKSASTSIIKTLNENRGKYVSREYLLESEKYKFSFIRNPFSRLVSGWNGWIRVDRPWLRKNKYFNYNMSFEDFIKTLCDMEDKDINYHFAPQKLFLYENNELMCDFVGKVENIQNDWKKLSEKFGLPPIKHFANTGIGNNYEKYYTDEMKELVLERFKDDFIKFNYNE